jgi:hypothetical protein
MSVTVTTYKTPKITNLNTDSMDDKQIRALYNKRAYQKKKFHRRLCYLKEQYPYIFIENKELLKQWLETNGSPTDEFIELVRSFIKPIDQYKASLKDINQLFDDNDSP